MAEKEAVQGDEGDRRQVRAIFSETGHRTLNALLIVSGGATVTFMTFLGAAVEQPNLAARIGNAATQSFADALKYFFMSVLFSVLAHGTTYASHAGHHYSATFSRNRAAYRWMHVVGQVFMWLTVVIGVYCFWYLWRGGFSAITGFGFVAEALQQGPAVSPSR